jgi:hypothetical protein
VLSICQLLGASRLEISVASLLDKNLHLRILVVDSDALGASRLSTAFSRVQAASDHSIGVTGVGTIKDAYEVLQTFRPNVLFIDLVSTNLRDSITYVQHVRHAHPTIVVVLYCRIAELEANQSDIYSGWGSRLRHYFLLSKETSDQSFDDQLLFNLSRVQLDLYAYGAQESLLRTERSSEFPALSPVQLSKLNTQVNLLSRELNAYLHGARASNEIQTNRRAFVIGAVADDLRDVYELGIKEPLSAQFGLEAYRIDEHYKDGLIIQRIYEEIHKSDVVIAELTHPRPNCYYELGFADGLAKPIIRIAKVGTELPFDVNQHPFLFYSDVTDLRDKLCRALIMSDLKPLTQK